MSYEAETSIVHDRNTAQTVAGFLEILDLYRAHMGEPDFWGEPITLRRRLAP